MMVMLHRDDDEHEVPMEWRETFQQIVNSFLLHDYRLVRHPVEQVAPIDPSIAENIAWNIEAYGSPLVALNPAIWERSVYRWMGDHWLFLVDLTTDGEEVSDLALHATWREEPAPCLTVQSVHVP